MVKILVLQYHLKEIFGLQKYTLVTLAHMQAMSNLKLSTLEYYKRFRQTDQPPNWPTNDNWKSSTWPAPLGSGKHKKPRTSIIIWVNIDRVFLWHPACLKEKKTLFGIFFYFIFNITNKLTWKSVTSQSLEFLQNITKEIEKHCGGFLCTSIGLYKKNVLWWLCCNEYDY